MKSKARLLMTIGALSFLSSCQTHKVSLTYNPPSFNQRVIKGEPSIKIDKINDVRNLRGSELGAIKNEFGIAIKAIQAKQPISEITRTAFSHALKSRNLLAEKDAKYILQADILQFECSQYSTQNAECRIRVHLYQAKTGRLIYSQYYYSTKTKVSPNDIMCGTNLKVMVILFYHLQLQLDHKDPLSLDQERGKIQECL